ncbi:hypothetical protein KKD70_04850 [Patescibacteria group bacterium]|nr:hypothetical protein [Patescibacteria group bacterium]
MKILAKIIDIFYPKTCISCEKHGDFLCNECKTKIKMNKEMFLDCKHKLLRDSPIQILFVPCPFRKNPILRKAVHLMKYKFYQDLAEDLGEFVARAIMGSASSDELRNAILVPIPLHKSKLKLRGFNQAELLANAISKHANIPVVTTLITRTRATTSQATLSRADRLENMKDAFEVAYIPSDFCHRTKIHNPGIATSLGGASNPIILIDDICTTLSTMKNAAKALQKAGFRVFLGAVIAHD